MGRSHRTCGSEEAAPEEENIGRLHRKQHTGKENIQDCEGIEGHSAYQN